MYIVIEWMGGTGKWTQTAILKERVQMACPWTKVHTVREPGSTIIAEAIRTLVQWTMFEEEMMPVTNAYLYAAARAQLIHGVVEPALERGEIVITDRNVLSSLAIQWNGLGYGLKNILMINKRAIHGVYPTSILFLDAPIEVTHARLTDQKGDRWEAMPMDFQKRCYEWYLMASKMDEFKDVRHTIDASASIEEVAERIWSVVEPTLSSVPVRNQKSDLSSVSAS